MGIRLSRNCLSEVLQEEGYVYRRPKKDLGHKQDADLREQVKEALDELKKRPKRERQATLYGRKRIQFELPVEQMLDEMSSTETITCQHTKSWWLSFGRGH